MYSKVFAYLVLSFGLLGVGLQTGRSLLGSEPLAYTLITHFYFTTQSNLLVVIITSIYLFKQKRGPLFTSFAFITLVNLSMTGIIFHALLTPYMGQISFLNHVLHTITPILYILFYFLIIQPHLRISKFWVSLIYPLVYLVLVYTIIEPFFGDLMERLFSTFSNPRFVYPFLDPASYETGVQGLLLFNLGILAPLIAIFSFILCYLKSKFEVKLSHLQ
ncbi:MAG TPA: hypothetical protein DHV05_01600 [Acholeplasmataceae bacterium]|nr:hypothetical protein [Acholeplasmataceae bacterium]